MVRWRLAALGIRFHAHAPDAEHIRNPLDIFRREFVRWRKLHRPDVPPDTGHLGALAAALGR